MTWVIVALLFVVYAWLMLQIGRWVGELLKAASGCTCTRHRICPWCLEALRDDREAA